MPLIQSDATDDGTMAVMLGVMGRKGVLSAAIRSRTMATLEKANCS
jgi:hypothetical protein